MKINTGQVSVFILALMGSTLVWIAVEKEPKPVQKEIEVKIPQADTSYRPTLYEFADGHTSTLKRDWITGEIGKQVN